MLRYIRIGRDVMEPSKKRNFNVGGDRGSHGGHRERSRGDGTRNSEGQNHRNGAGFGSRKGGHLGGDRMEISVEAEVRKGEMVTTPPP